MFVKVASDGNQVDINCGNQVDTNCGNQVDTNCGNQVDINCENQVDAATRHDDDPHLTIRGRRYMAIHGNPAPVPTL